jgi:hypothetical protein
MPVPITTLTKSSPNKINGTKSAILPFKDGAGNETRTRDIKLGKLALYQLSYARISGTI